MTIGVYQINDCMFFILFKNLDLLPLSKKTCHSSLILSHQVYTKILSIVMIQNKYY